MDFLNHLLDAPIANVLVVAGLLFLAIGAVGKITGKLEPDTTGRIMCGLLGLVLLVGGIFTHVQSDSKKDAAKPEQPSSLQPVIHAFSATPSQVIKGGKVTIHWEVLNADDVELQPFGQVAATGSTTDEPQQTTIYKLTATNKGGGKQGTFQEVIVRDAKTLPSPSEPKPRVKESAPVVPGTSQAIFAGTWLNDDVKTRSITRLIISQAGSRVSVHAFGACGSSECDWGSQDGSPQGRTAN